MYQLSLINIILGMYLAVDRKHPKSRNFGLLRSSKIRFLSGVFGSTAYLVLLVDEKSGFLTENKNLQNKFSTKSIQIASRFYIKIYNLFL